jgi:cytochrome c peroxidase
MNKVLMLTVLGAVSALQGPEEFAIPQNAPQGTPIRFVDSSEDEWGTLKAFWNSGREVRIKVPLGLPAPVAPKENQPTVEKWLLGRALFNDKMLSSNGTVSCSSCHLPQFGMADNSALSTGINGNKTEAHTPTILNVGFHPELFWDGRAKGLEAQAQEPVTNTREMFDGVGDPWALAIERIKAKGYSEAFKRAFGTDATKDAVARSIATYMRTIFSGGSIHDRAVESAALRGDMKISPYDFEVGLHDSDSFQREAVGADGKNDAAIAERIDAGRRVFVKAKCATCHSGELFSDSDFHNLRVGELTFARFAGLPTGLKDSDTIGAVKTPGLRGLARTAPYGHTGQFSSLAGIVQHHLNGGGKDKRLESGHVVSVSPLLRPVNLSVGERNDLITFLMSLEGEAVDQVVTDPDRRLP